MTERLTRQSPCRNCNINHEQEIGNPYKWSCACDKCSKHEEWKMNCFRKLAELETVEEEGRLVVFPCKIGDYIWDIDFDEPCAYKVTGFSTGNLNDDYYDNEVTKFNEIIVHYSKFNGGITGSFAISEIGKTVFLTREEAEEALEKLCKR